MDGIAVWQQLLETHNESCFAQLLALPVQADHPQSPGITSRDFKFTWNVTYDVVVCPNIALFDRLFSVVFSASFPGVAFTAQASSIPTGQELFRPL